jgi:ketopantoate hydroxymethyltransferase
MSIHFQQKEVWVSTHAVKQARKSHIIYPDMVYATINGGTIKRFGKNCIKFFKKYKRGTVICVGEELSHAIIIKTVEWGN